MSFEPVNPFLPPKSDDLASGVKDPSAEFGDQLRNRTRGMRAAGAYLIANGVLAAVVGFDQGMGAHLIGTAIDCLLGFFLLRGSRGAANITLFRIAFGIIRAVMDAFQGDSEHLIAFALLTTSLVLLLVGNPGKVRFTTGCVLFALYFVVSALTLGLSMTGEDLTWFEKVDRRAPRVYI